ncbi:MAG TPA: thioredoxin domain-containing protein, partial [Mycobacteriales bacterium]|nr:thioredoxin domain-containing protein [Mycobacteriales bacterium]
MANRLADSTSPYLLQHKDNPVDWWPWCPEAFDEARRLNRPVLLSVGYAACHWCHVMAHESFEDEAAATYVNKHFVAIKVDREERPDVDAVYMEATQAMTGHGGWPMTCFLTPSAEPFFCGTYFPPDDRPGMPSFLRLCASV